MHSLLIHSLLIEFRVKKIWTLVTNSHRDSQSAFRSSTVTYDIKGVTEEIHLLEKRRRNLFFIWLTSNCAPWIKGLKFTYLIFSILEGYPGTDPWQQVVKQGPGEPAVALEVAVIQAQKMVEFPKLCVSLEDQTRQLLDFWMGFLQQVHCSNLHRVVKLNQVPPFSQKCASF